ncbi:helix-turn-helix domain-containing protein [Mucilaginibacter flavidus]|uniref:helix-turn-helix domain-containing protein n=1 Tax=Mucilaginibacter flavidus TaxID=2949309 RepID=UPI002093FEDC|nr:helix-turn-helix domain-containing protein [Mucilaginibacter flavidus]MCO5947971.1 helix-turn-helix domain-containing protein [Mucilaginibacter flavidus]
MINRPELTLNNPQTGEVALKIISLEYTDLPNDIQCQNCFTFIWIRNGAGKINTDFNEYDFESGSLFNFACNQPYKLKAEPSVKGIAVYFHADFFYMYKDQKELQFNEVLGNDPRRSPFTKVDEKGAGVFKMIFEQIAAEMQNCGLAQHELLVSYLKIFLVAVSRLKQEQQSMNAGLAKPGKAPFILQKLKTAIEENFRTKHSSGDYAELLHTSPKVLAKIIKTHFNKTPSCLINERIIMEAKRNLHTQSKRVKEIAYELGFEDEYYFSRFFKINTGMTPQLFREQVGYRRAG